MSQEDIAGKNYACKHRARGGKPGEPGLYLVWTENRAKRPCFACLGEAGLSGVFKCRMTRYLALEEIRTRARRASLTNSSDRRKKNYRCEIDIS